jgi:hypothetical protein
MIRSALELGTNLAQTGGPLPGSMDLTYNSLGSA